MSGRNTSIKITISIYKGHAHNHCPTYIGHWVQPVYSKNKIEIKKELKVSIWTFHQHVKALTIAHCGHEASLTMCCDQYFHTPKIHKKIKLNKSKINSLPFIKV